MRDLPIQKVRLLGGKLGEELTSLGYETAGHVEDRLSMGFLCSRFGDRLGTYVFHAVRGEDFTPGKSHAPWSCMLADVAQWRHASVAVTPRPWCRDTYVVVAHDFVAAAAGNWSLLFSVAVEVKAIPKSMLAAKSFNPTSSLAHIRWVPALSRRSAVRDIPSPDLYPAFCMCVTTHCHCTEHVCHYVHACAASPAGGGCPFYLRSWRSAC